jgi:hypothetical protein
MKTKIFKMKAQELVEKKNLNTMVDCVNSLVLQGFNEDFKAREAGLESLSSHKLYKPEEVKILNFYRFEGESDPADNSILYAIETSDGKRGTLVDAYGPYADSKVTKFIHQVEEIQKKTDREATL